MSVESEFVRAALEIGLAEAVAETMRDIDRAIAELPQGPGSRYAKRLDNQRDSLRRPTLRTTAALVVSICIADPSRTPIVRRAFARLADRHPELAGFYGQLPAAADDGLRRTA
ncbi:hypothetical protein [Caulobacter rhizosphaerae]|uniref:hypothetical protein n=1 Tax=Caulobacter rhizosphaerae TaxID=2010972 RepID=UPI0013D86B8C|nr:hypothetical protein [Caulobacter rhizosphaerae]GGL35687.1 hypothetical protein GCM10010983_35850 [Caulobacter rhizosphaerae]